MSGPGKDLAADVNVEGGKRFRFTGLHARLRGADAHPVSLQAVPAAEENVDVTTSHLGAAVVELSERNLSERFTSFVAEIRPRILSLPLILRGRAWLITCACNALRDAARNQPLAIEPISLCIAALARDLGVSYFYPFFPDVIAAFADVFSGPDVTSLLWNPQLAVLPVFAALSAITKLLVRQLVANPSETLLHIAPLLGHNHYRIREMTADSCVGYIMRKARQCDVLDLIVHEVISVPEITEKQTKTSYEDIPIVHGAGAALFEAMRSLNGGLHSRALRVLATALNYASSDNNGKLQSLSASSNAENQSIDRDVCGESFSRLRFAVLVHAVARISLHCSKNLESFKQIVEVIVSHGDAGLQKSSSCATADALFFLRHCVHMTGAAKGITALPDPHLQRISNLFFNGLSCFPDDSRFCFEGLSCFLSIFERAASQRAHRMALSSKKHIASASHEIKTSSLVSMLQSFAAWINKIDVNTSNASQLVPVVIVVCDSFFRRENELPLAVSKELHNFPSDMSELCKSSYYSALTPAVAFYSKIQDKSIIIDAPAVEKQILSALDAIVSFVSEHKETSAILSAESTAQLPPLVRTILEYTRQVKIDASVEHILRLATFSASPGLLSVLASSILQNDTVALRSDSQGTEEVEKKLRGIIVTLLQAVLTNDFNESVLASINLYVYKRNSDSLFATFLEEEVGSIVQILSSNLCSSSSSIRNESVLLLERLTACKSKERGPVEAVAVSQFHRYTMQDAIVIRALLAEPRSGICPDTIIFKAIRIVFSAPRDLENVTLIREVIGQLAILSRRPSRLSAKAKFALCNFTMGLFCIKFQPLWQVARGLWGTLAQVITQEAWHPMRLALLETRNQILHRFISNSSNGKKDIELDNNESDNEIPENEVTEGVLSEKSTKDENETNQAEAMSKKRPRAGELEETRSITLDKTLQTKNNTTLQRKLRKAMKTMFVLTWAVDEWKSACNQRSIERISGSPLSDNESSLVDPLTRHVEYLKTLCTFPKTTVTVRKLIVDLYLALDPVYLSRKTGDLLLKQYGILMEKMGGLKITENDQNLCSLLRARLLNDLSRPCCSTQTEILRCLCASRSPELKPYKESLLRIVSESTFREELALLTDSLCALKFETLPSSKEENARVVLTVPMVDVLVRLCYSKMRGKRKDCEARRGAAAAFIMTSLPAEFAIPSLVNLTLDKMADLVDKIAPPSSRSSESFSVDLSAQLSEYPNARICRGVVKSLDSVLKHMWMSIPMQTWRQIAVALYVALATSLQVSRGQDIRADALRLLAFMLEKNRDLSSCFSMSVLQLMGDRSFDASGTISVTAAPALLKFVAACFRNLPFDSLMRIMQLHTWVCDWSLRMLRSETCNTQTVNLVLDVALGIINVKKALAQAPIRIENCGSAKPCTEFSDLGLGECLINVLSDALRARLSHLQKSADNNWHRNRSIRDSLESIMNVLTEMTSCITLEREVVLSLADSLLFIITESKLYGAPLISCIIAFDALGRRLSQSPSEDTFQKKFVSRLIPLFSSPSFASQLEAKEALCNAICHFDDEALQMVSYLVKDMFAMSKVRIGEADLDLRVNSFSALIKVLKRSLDESNETHEIVVSSSDISSTKTIIDAGEIHANGNLSGSAVCSESAVLLIAHSCVAAVKDSDVSVRGTSSFTLQLLSKWTHTVTSAMSQKIRNSLTFLLATESTSFCTNAARREYCKALGNLVRPSPPAMCIEPLTDGTSLLRSLHLLTDQLNLEADFFENIAHLQVHRRSRAMRRLAKKLEEMNVEKTISLQVAESVRSFVFPLSKRIALDVLKEDEETLAKSSRRSKESKMAYNRDVTSAAVTLNQEASSYLMWREYKKEITLVIRRIPHELDEARADILYSLLVGLATKFPGCVDEGEDGVKNAQGRFLRSYLLPKMISFISSGAVEGEVQITLQNVKNDKSGGVDRSQTAVVFRAQVAIAVAKLILRLEDSELNDLIPSLVTPLANALRSRMYDVRTRAKKVLVEVVTLLDPKFFAFTVDQVISALVNGFRKDSIVYVIHALLVGIREHRSNLGSSSKLFSIDPAARKLCKALADELEDGLNTSRTGYLNPNANDSRLKEAAHRAIRVSEAAQILGELVTFPVSASTIIKPFAYLLIGTNSPKFSSRLQITLQRIGSGFSRNVTMTADDGLKFSFNLINSNLPSPNMFDEGHDGNVSNQILQKQLQKLVEGRTFSNSPNSHVLAELGWQLLDVLLAKKVQAQGISAEHRKSQAMVEPFVPELLLSMRSRYDSLTRFALKCAQRVLRLPISSRREIADMMAATTVEVLSRSLGVSVNPGAPLFSKSSSEDSLFTTCLRAAAVLIHEMGYQGEKGIKKERVEGLLKISRNVLDQNSVETRSAALALIKSTVTKKIALPDVYDTIEHVSKLAIRAQSTSLRSSCINISVQFLLNFPLGKKRIRQHLEFFVRNLSYELPHGRLASIDVIVALIEQLPEKNLVEEAEYFFVSLTSVVIRDNDQQCRKSAAAALKALFSAVSDGRIFSSMLNMSHKFVNAASRKDSEISSRCDEDADIVRSGAVAISSASQSGKLSKEQLQESLRLVAAASVRHCSISWECLYGLLYCIEQLLSAQPDTVHVQDAGELWCDLQSFWEGFNQLLLHNHEWIRLAASRLLGRHFSAAGGRETAIVNSNKDVFCILWARNGLLREILKSVCLQFEAKLLSEELAKQSLKNVLCLANMIWKCPEAGDIAGLQQDVELDDNANVGKQDTNRPFTWLVARMSGMCTRVGKEENSFLRRACGIRFLMVAIEWWGEEVLSGRLESFVSPIVQILESGAQTSKKQFRMSNADNDVVKGNDSSDNEKITQETDDMSSLRVLAESLQQSIQEKSGAGVYFKIYQSLVEKRRAAKNEKKRSSAIQTAINPERAAKRRRQKAESRAARRRATRSDDRRTRFAKVSGSVFEKGENINLREEM